MSHRFRRALRAAVALTATAVPLAGAGIAEGAMAGANPLTTTSRPDLRTATLTGASSAQFCFDKALTSVPNVGGFSIGGYRSDRIISSNNATVAGNCVDATFNSTLAHRSFGQVAEGAVRAGLFGNRADSTALTGSQSHNGTRGLTTAPDLQGVALVNNNQVAYTFDEPVNSSAIVGTGGFHVYLANGVLLPTDVASNSAGISPTDPTTVIATFPVGSNLTSNAVRAYILPGAVSSNDTTTGSTNGTPSTYDSAVVPGSGGATPIADLISANYSRQRAAGLAGSTLPLGLGFPATCNSVATPAVNSCVVVDYTFDQAVTLPGTTGANLLSAFKAYLSDGSSVSPAFVYEPSGISVPGLTTGGLAGSNVVRAVFTDASAYDEYLVKAAVTSGIIENLLRPILPVGGFPLTNTIGSAPIGGNTGAFSSGFSTAADAFNATFDTATNTASVLFDQRVFFATPPNFRLLDANGNASIGSASTASGCPPGTVGFPCPLATGNTDPGQYTVYLTFAGPTALVGNATALEIQGSVGTLAGSGAFATLTGPRGTAVDPLAGNTRENVQQIVSPAAVSNVRKLGRATHVSHRRMTRALVRRVNAKQARQLRRNLKAGKYSHTRHHN